MPNMATRSNYEKNCKQPVSFLALYILSKLLEHSNKQHYTMTTIRQSQKINMPLAHTVFDIIASQDSRRIHLRSSVHTAYRAPGQHSIRSITTTAGDVY